MKFQAISPFQLQRYEEGEPPLEPPTRRSKKLATYKGQQEWVLGCSKHLGGFFTWKHKYDKKGKKVWNQEEAIEMLHGLVCTYLEAYKGKGMGVPDLIVMLDGDPAWKPRKTESVKIAMQEIGVSLIYLPPTSPDFSPWDTVLNDRLDRMLLSRWKKTEKKRTAVQEFDESVEKECKSVEFTKCVRATISRRLEKNALAILENPRRQF